MRAKSLSSRPHARSRAASCSPSERGPERTYCSSISRAALTSSSWACLGQVCARSSNSFSLSATPALYHSRGNPGKCPRPAAQGDFGSRRSGPAILGATAMLGQIEDSGQHELLNGFCLIGAMGRARTQAELRRVRRDQHHEFDQGDRRLSAVTAGRLRISDASDGGASLCCRTRLFVGSRDETRISLCSDPASAG